MKRRQKVVLTDGDVREIVVVHREDHTRLVIYQGGEVIPLIQAILANKDRQALIRALSDP